MITKHVSAISYIRNPLVNDLLPKWASGWGQDPFGIFVEFSLLASRNNLVTQRMRWIPAGTSLMGSPDDEPGRHSDELLQHKVTKSEAIWMFDSPCPQAMWNVVMGTNPSRFVDPQRPVEQVSWDEVQAFIERLNSKVPGIALRLPTESEWEYACRAGTREATYAGPIEILGAYNAPILHEIAWYGGNSGVDFELNDGRDSTRWTEKQFTHQIAGTRKVSMKRPNRWGLFDMLGNVWEWCDNCAQLTSEVSVNPKGNAFGLDRVLRGGGWDSEARNVRSAHRRIIHRNTRESSIGFRCVRVQEF